jgi:hypothetical protein
MVRLLLVLVLALPGGSSCSLLVHFDEENRPCGPDEDPMDGLGDCLEGYSCMFDACVANRSVPVGYSCSVNAHCEPGAVCTSLTCHPSCQYPYGNVECGTNQACITMADVSGNATGVCRSGDCTQSPCNGPNTVCIEVKSGVGRCFDSCEVECDAAGCDGDCMAVAGDSKRRACQPVGPGDVLACVMEGDGNHGDACDLKSWFCDSHHACIMPPDGGYGVCIKYCQDGAVSCDRLTDPSTELTAECHPVTPVAGPSFSVCGQLPSEPPSDGGPQEDDAGGDRAGDQGSGSGD